MVIFHLKVIQDSRIWGLLGARPRLSNHLISDDKSQIWATFRQKTNIGHKSTYSSFKKLVYRYFFVWPNFNFFAYWPPLTSNTLRGQTQKLKRFLGSILFFIRMLKTIAVFWQLFFWVRLTFQLRVRQTDWKFWLGQGWADNGIIKPKCWLVVQ